MDRVSRNDRFDDRGPPRQPTDLERVLDKLDRVEQAVNGVAETLDEFADAFLNAKFPVRQAD